MTTCNRRIKTFDDTTNTYSNARKGKIMSLLAAEFAVAVARKIQDLEWSLRLNPNRIPTRFTLVALVFVLLRNRCCRCAISITVNCRFVIRTPCRSDCNHLNSNCTWNTHTRKLFLIVKYTMFSMHFLPGDFSSNVLDSPHPRDSHDTYFCIFDSFYHSIATYLSMSVRICTVHSRWENIWIHFSIRKYKMQEFLLRARNSGSLLLSVRSLSLSLLSAPVQIGERSKRIFLLGRHDERIRHKYIR